MSLRDYRQPPVHEVILSVQFQAGLDAVILENVPALVSADFQSSERMERMETEFSLGAATEPEPKMKKHFEGWQFKDAGPSRVLRAQRSQFSLHAVRPGNWPDGSYAGWSSIGPWAFGLIDRLRLYQPLQIKRAGLRYLNRIAIPTNSLPSQWFALFPRGPEFLTGLHTFNLAQTWSQIAEHDRFGATVRLAKIAIENPEVAKGNQGVLLDIDVFNLLVARAPQFDQLVDWFEEAHTVENMIFEHSITEELGNRFGRI